MPEMSSAHSVKSLNHKFTKNELARALRLAIADEYEAIQIYEQIAESVEDDELKAIIMHIVEEEQKHADQFWDLLARVKPEEHELYDSAVEENKEIIQKIKR
ncbi:MAG: rubrerythrin [Euryarchaeota archaeon]|nr:rubrerythrin [Euryarchaeota archaeon]